jgi:hypothetical protein
MIKTEKEKIKTILAQSFKKTDKTQFYFVKGLKQYSNSIVVKGKNNFDKKILNDVKLILRQELKNSVIELYVLFPTSPTPLHSHMSDTSLCNLHLV